MATIFAHAVIKGVDSQPRKTNVVASLVRDRYVADAVVILENTPRRAARAVRKAIESAAANLLNNSGVSIDPKSLHRSHQCHRWHPHASLCPSLSRSRPALRKNLQQHLRRSCRRGKS